MGASHSQIFAFSSFNLEFYIDEIVGAEIGVKVGKHHLNHKVLRALYLCKVSTSMLGSLMNVIETL